MNYYKLGFFAGIIVFNIIFVLIILILIKRDGDIKGRIKGKYDERQELVRGRGYKYAFYTLLLYGGLIEYIAAIAEKRFMDGTIQTVIGMCISIAVYACYCIWHESYFAINENPKRVLIILIVIGAFNYFIGISNLMEGAWIKDGQLTFRIANFACGILTTLVSIVVAAKWISNKKKEE